MCAPAESTRHPIDRATALTDVLETPALAKMYTYVRRNRSSTVRQIVDELGVPQGTAYDYVKRLESTGFIAKTGEERPYEYKAKDVTLTLSADDESRTITPQLVAAAALREENGDIELFVERHGLDGLATALEYAEEYVKGEINHRIAARELGISPLEAEIILQALEPVVPEE
ncbi:MAG: hypothetical protein MAG715_01270 [Methanonatronarchaeales archaeon]|nr:hypothetical protein [Methanonatronarchaeales archaeon]